MLTAQTAGAAVLASTAQDACEVRLNGKPIRISQQPNQGILKKLLIARQSTRRSRRADFPHRAPLKNAHQSYRKEALRVIQSLHGQRNSR